MRTIACVFALLTLATASRADSVEDARAVYAQGKAAYDRGDYQDALSQFSRAYALRPAPALLFNMAQASRLSGREHCAEALGLYERYLREDPAPENRTEVEERIVQMHSCADEESERSREVAAAPGAVPPPPPPAAAPTPPEPVSPPRVVDSSPKEARRSPPLAAVLATGIGASVAIAGGVLYLRARSKYEDAQAHCPCPEGTYSDWEALTTASYAMMAGGAVVAGTGAAFWVFSSGDADGAKPTGAGVRFTGRF